MWNEFGGGLCKDFFPDVLSGWAGEVEAWRGTRRESLGHVGHPSAVGSASPWPTLVATGPCPVMAWLLLAIGVLCLTVQYLCVRFHSASDSQSSGIGLLVFSKSRCGRTNQPPRDFDGHTPQNISGLFVVCFFVFFFLKHQLTVFSLTVCSFLKYLREASLDDLFYASFLGRCSTCQVWVGDRDDFFFF